MDCHLWTGHPVCCIRPDNPDYEQPGGLLNSGHPIRPRSCGFLPQIHRSAGHRAVKASVW